MMKISSTKKAPAAATTDVKNIDKKSSTNNYITPSKPIYGQVSPGVYRSMTLDDFYYLMQSQHWSRIWHKMLSSVQIEDLSSKKITARLKVTRDLADHFSNRLMKQGA